jgi:hypothetical protein
MAKSKVEAAFKDAERRHDQGGAPLPTTPEEPMPNIPPLSPSAQARRDAEIELGRQRVAASSREQERLLGLAAQQRADALAEGKTSPDDLG